MKQIGIIIIFFGAWPDWFAYFLQSCAYNKKIHWFIFSDQKAFWDPFSNIFYQRFKQTDFETLVHNKLGVEIRLSNPNKLCDYKPVYGKLFEDYLSAYDYWGYSDIDMIYGDLDKFIQMDELINYDILSGYRGYLSGPFCLFKNKPEINMLFEKISNFKKSLEIEQCLGLDENVPAIHRGSQLVKRYLYLIPYFLRNLWMLGAPFPDIKYNYQWYLKRIILNPDYPRDMTEVVYNETKQKNITAHFKPLILSDRHYNRIGKANWKVTWDHGIMKSNISNKEIMAFHLVDSKNNPEFTSEKEIKYSERFRISHHGIRCSE